MKKTFKSVLALAFVITITSLGLYSCSEDSSTSLVSSEESFTNNTAARAANLSAGSEIAYLDANNGIQLSVSEPELVDYLNNGWAGNLTPNVANVEIKKIPVQGVLNESVYVLFGSSLDKFTKVGLILDVVIIPATGTTSARPVLSLSSEAKVSCTSTQCQFGCNPASLVNPKTGKPVLTCSSCTNTCTKTASI